MSTLVGTLGLLVLVGRAIAALNAEGVQCGEKRCSTLEYCSPYDKHCKPCSSICEPADRNYQPLECASDCQEYLHDKRYVLLKQYEDLRGEIGKLWILVAISIAVAVLALLPTLYLLARKLARWEKMRGAARRAFAGKWTKRSSTGSSVDDATTATANNNNNNNNNNHRRKTANDAELGAAKPNGLKLTMPTISGNVVAPTRHSVNERGSGSGSGNGNATPNTSTTTLSRRHPSEDTTLDYAYDNPAMTPSPESAQPRTKRESSF